ncbi:hypothetical protein ElyMa_001262300 [Elysia marginata]|uniref:Uncharacterized protein n=1 Tax=Elysia marginata TaxID=1093978 RepID=A0AAV4IEW9_9GAST|nr:hypothetical protein ElyMa_001262300 [Elysia marginata]
MRDSLKEALFSSTITKRQIVHPSIQVPYLSLSKLVNVLYPNDPRGPRDEVITACSALHLHSPPPTANGTCWANTDRSFAHQCQRVPDLGPLMSGAETSSEPENLGLSRG